MRGGANHISPQRHLASRAVFLLHISSVVFLTSHLASRRVGLVILVCITLLLYLCVYHYCYTYMYKLCRQANHISHLVIRHKNHPLLSQGVKGCKVYALHPCLLFTVALAVALALAHMRFGQSITMWYYYRFLLA